MRIGVDFHTWDGIYQGSRSHILGLYKAAITAFPEIDFYFFGSNLGTLLKQHPEFAGRNAHLVEMRRAPAVWRLLFQLPFLSFKFDLDALHTQYRIPFISKGISVCTIHDVLVESHPEYFSARFAILARRMFRYAAKRADVLLTVSDFSKREIARLYGRRASVTHNGVDFARFSPRALDANTLKRYGLSEFAYWLSVGRIEPRKNYVGIIRGWISSGRTDLPLVIVGQRDFRFDDVFVEAERCGLSGQIRFLDDVSDSDLPSLYAGCHAFLYLSHAEGFGMPALEALACGAPAIVSDRTSLPEIAGNVATVVDPMNVQEVGREMARLCRRDSAIESNVEHAKRFSWPSSAQTLVMAIRGR
jgi:glycosyltransferase involved in cell wall biosynthesis